MNVSSCCYWYLLVSLLNFVAYSNRKRYSLLILVTSMILAMSDGQWILLNEWIGGYIWINRLTNETNEVRYILQHHELLSFWDCSV